MLPKAKLAAVVALDEVLMRVRDAANWRGAGGVRYTAGQCRSRRQRRRSPT